MEAGPHDRVDGETPIRDPVASDVIARAMQAIRGADSDKWLCSRSFHKRCHVKESHPDRLGAEDYLAGIFERASRRPNRLQHPTYPGAVPPYFSLSRARSMSLGKSPR